MLNSMLKDNSIPGGGGGGGGGGEFKIALAVRFHHYQLLSSDALLSPWQWCL